MNEAEILDWAYSYLKNRDLIFRKIESMNRKDARIAIKYKDGTSELVVPINELSELKLEQVKMKTSVFLPNTKKNLDFLIKNWKKFAKVMELKFVFFNPHSAQENRWIIKPAVHDRISDSKSLKQGLKAMFESVDVIS